MKKLTWLGTILLRISTDGVQFLLRYLAFLFSVFLITPSVKAQESLVAIMENQSTICQYIIGVEAMNYCYLSAGPEHYNPIVPPCSDRYPIDLTEDVEVLDGRLTLACFNLEIIHDEERLVAMTNLERKSLITSIIECAKPILAEEKQKYTCPVLDYSRFIDEITFNP